MNIPLYIHIPFCRRKCRYCDFYSIPYDERRAEAYVGVLRDQVAVWRSRGCAFSTVYFGGGTPSVLPPPQLSGLILACDPQAAREVTVEVNPESANRALYDLLRESGVNRLSVGVQSFDDRALALLGRLHTGCDARRAVEDACSAGFENVSIDLIYAVPGFDVASWKKTLDTAVRLPVRHISLYSLTYEEGTPLHAARCRKEIAPAPEEHEEAMYRLAQDMLSRHGFRQYEVSSFSRPGYESMHNGIYWENAAYLGLGAGAVSYVEGMRCQQVPSVDEYVARYLRGEDTRISCEELDPQQRALETAVLNLRTAAGIDFVRFQTQTGYDIRVLRGTEFEQLRREGLLEIDENGTRPTVKGFGFYDHIARTLL